MAWQGITTRKLAITEELPSEYLTVGRIDKTKPAIIEDLMPAYNCIHIKAENTKVVELHLERYLESRGLTRTQILNHVNTISMYERIFKVVIEAKSPLFFAMHIPRVWRIKSVTVDGKVPPATIVDVRGGAIFVPILESSSPAEVILELEPSTQYVMNVTVGLLAGVTALTLLKPFTRLLLRRIRRG